MCNILVVGSINMDVVVPIQCLPKSGETIAVDDIAQISGGKGANAAVAAARLGANVRMVGSVGADAFGREVLNAMCSQGVDCQHVQVGNRQTGTAVIHLDKKTGQNSIMVGAGANNDIQLPPGDQLFQWADVVMLQLETPLDINIEALRRAKTTGTLVVLDPAPATCNLPAELLTLPTILSPNETELATLTGYNISGIEDAVVAGKLLLDRGSQQLVVKLGHRGSLWVHRDGVHHAPPINVNVVDTTAAGDAFTAALAVSFAQGKTIPESMTQGSIAGGLACSRFGAQTSLPSLSELLVHA